LPLSTTRKAAREVVQLKRNFLHSAELEFTHPISGKLIQLKSPLPPELEGFLTRLKKPAAGADSSPVLGGDAED
jgi:23S rRNA pseudouridine1911/1915/1917 synthase